MIDFTCDLNCPGENFTCCRYCANGRKDFVNESNKHLWDDYRGFLGEDGCRLSREQMPSGCKTFDCRQYSWAVEKMWFRGKWAEHCLGQTIPGRWWKQVDITL